MSKKTIVTILLIVLIGMLITDININGFGVFELFFHRLNTDSIEKLHIGGGYQEKYSHNGTLNFNAMSVNSLDINNPMGSVVLIGEDGEEVKVEYDITVYGRTVKRAEEYAKQIKVEKTGTKNIKLSLKKPDDSTGIQAVKVAYYIKAPREIYPDIKNKYGKLEVNNFKNGAKLSNGYEETDVKDISGNVEIRAAYGDLDVTNIEGKVNIHTSYNSVNIRDISKNLSIEADYSEVDINNIKGKLDFESRYGEASLNNINNTDIKSDYTEIDISRINGPLTADMNYGELNLSEIKNDLNFTGNYTDIEGELSPELDNFSLNSELEYGNIDTNFLVTKREDDNYEKVTTQVGTGEVKIKIKTEHADIKIYK